MTRIGCEFGIYKSELQHFALRPMDSPRTKRPGVDFPPRSGGLRSECHAAMAVLTAVMVARACTGVW
jgi:hypothetical protein